MKLQQVLDTLASGELSNLSIVDNGKVKTDSIGKVVANINLALTDLHTRFLLKLGTITVNLQPNQTVYPLKAAYQVGQRAPTGTLQFIGADGDKLNNDLLKVNQVHAYYVQDESGFSRRPVEIGVNERDDWQSVFTTSYDVLNVPLHLQTKGKVANLRVTYQKNAVPICQCDDDYDAECIEVDIPYSHLWALCLFVASRMHNPSGFGTGGVHEGNNYWAKYAAECDRLEQSNMDLDYSAANIGRLRKGFP